jgi:hypothetical protein
MVRVWFEVKGMVRVRFKCTQRGEVATPIDNAKTREKVKTQTYVRRRQHKTKTTQDKT